MIKKSQQINITSVKVHQYKINDLRYIKDLMIQLLNKYHYYDFSIKPPEPSVYGFSLNNDGNGTNN